MKYRNGRVSSSTTSITATKTRTAPRNLESSGVQGDAPTEIAGPESTFGGSAAADGRRLRGRRQGGLALGARRRRNSRHRSGTSTFAQRLVAAVAAGGAEQPARDVVDSQLLPAADGRHRDREAGRLIVDRGPVAALSRVVLEVEPTSPSGSASTAVPGTATSPYLSRSRGKPPRTYQPIPSTTATSEAEPPYERSQPERGPLIEGLVPGRRSIGCSRPLHLGGKSIR